MARLTRTLMVAITLGLVAPSGAAAAAGSDPPAGPVLPTVEEVMAAFTSAALTTTSIDSPTPGDGMTLTDWQAGNMARQAAAGVGLTGHQLRAAFPVGPEVVPIDAIVAAWLIEHGSASADAARSILAIDVGTITDPGLVVYPWAVLVLFVNDLMGSADEPAGWRSAPAAPASPGGVCGALSDFYTAMKTAVIDALDDVPLLGTLAELAVALFEQVLGIALQPLLVPVKLAISALGVAALVAHIVDPWVFYIHKEPLLVIDYGVAPNPGNPGTFEARIEGGAILEWPAALQACAQLAGVSLPDLDPNGATVTWTPSFGSHATVTSQDPTISDDGSQYTATLGYVTAVEPADFADGPLASAVISVSVTAHRPEGQQLDAIVEQIVGDALSGLPGPVAEILASLAGSAIGSVAHFNDPSGTGSITVRFHSPPPPESTAPTTSPPTTTPTSGCIGRLLQGVGRLAGTTLEFRTDGTWSIDFTAYPPQEFQGVLVILSGQMIGTWTLTADGTGFVVVTDLNSPFTATGSYQGTTIEVTIQQLIDLFALFGAPTGPNLSVATCANGAITASTGEVLYS